MEDYKRELAEFEKQLNGSPEQLMSALIQKANRHAETLAGLTRGEAPVGAVAGGRTRQSIQGFVRVEGDTLTGGVRSDYPVAWFQEFGTGPVAEAAGYPGAVQVPHVQQGWWWPSGETGQLIKAERHGGDPEDYNELTYTEGQPPKAMFHKAIEAYGDKITEDFGNTVLEVFLE